MLDTFRRRMLVGLVVLVLALPIIATLIQAYHTTLMFGIVMVVVNAVLLLTIGGLIVRSWVRPGTPAPRAPVLLIQLLLLLWLVAFLGLAIHQVVS